MKSERYRTRSRKVSWMSDFDYMDKLSLQDSTWLDAFNRAYYGGDFRKLESLDVTTQQSIKSASYNQQYKQKTDVLNNYKTVEISTLQAADIIDEN